MWLDENASGMLTVERGLDANEVAILNTNRLLNGQQGHYH